MQEKTEKNVRAAFVGEAKAYFRLLAYAEKAEDEGEKGAAFVFSHDRDAETFHAKLYERAIFQSMKEDVKAYQVCQVCGFVTDKKAPKKCPVCEAPREQFKAIEPNF